MYRLLLLEANICSPSQQILRNCVTQILTNVLALIDYATANN